MTYLIPPYGGSLKNRYGSCPMPKTRDLPAWTLTPRQLCDLELLLDGGFRSKCAGIQAQF